MKINDLERALGVKRSSIFYYEREGLLSPRREDNNYREYTGDDLKRLKTVIVLRKLGFTVEEIRQLLHGERALTDVLPDNLARLEAQASELGEAMALCREMERRALTMDSLDPDEWFETIESRENEGRHFMDLLDDASEGVTKTLAFVQDSIGFQGPVYAQIFFSEEGIKKRRLWKLYWGMLAFWYLVLLAEVYLLPQGRYMRLASPAASLGYVLLAGVVGSLVLWFCARYIIPGRKPRRALWLTLLIVAAAHLPLTLVGQQALSIEADEEARASYMSDRGYEAYVGDDPAGYVQTAYNERYHGGTGELDVWQTEGLLLVFASWGDVYRFRPAEPG